MNTGGAVYVNWDEVDAMAHLQPEPAAIKIVKGTDEETETSDPAETSVMQGSPRHGPRTAAGNDELEAIFLRTYGKSKRDEAIRRANLSHGMRERAANRQLRLRRAARIQALEHAAPWSKNRSMSSTVTM